ncbi:MAG: hypothetical protein IPJ26_19395 [Bacteroidetes bacterium]|nr:hypothetical protein [Bacteroidota bacterium]
MPRNSTLLLNSKQIQQRIDRLAFQVYEDNFNQSELLIAGIAKSGFLFAERLCDALKKICPIPVKLIKIEVDKENPIKIKNESVARKGSVERPNGYCSGRCSQFRQNIDV